MRTGLMLFITLAAIEAAIMLLLKAVGITTQYFWLETFIDASCAAVIGSVLIRALLKRRIIQSGHTTFSDALLFQIGLVLFGTQTLLMLLLRLTNLQQGSISIIALDSVGFACVATLIIKTYLLSPAVPTTASQPAWRKIQSQSKSVLLALYLFCLSLFMLFLMNVYKQQYTVYETQLIERETQQLTLIKEELSRQVAQATLDVQVLSRQQHLMSALDGNQFSFYELGEDYLSLAMIKPYYEQIRFIDNRGAEQIRIDRNQLSPFITAESQLQNKAGRYYFDETMRLGAEAIYISPLDLNIEHGRIEMPFKPIIRAASPVFDDYGRKRGIVIINLNASNLLSHLKAADQTTTGELMLLNEAGYWLFGERRAAAWAFMFPQYQDRTIEKLYPGIWESIKPTMKGTLRTPYGAILFETIQTGVGIQPEKLFPEQWPTWKLMLRIQDQQIADELAEFSLLMVIYFILVAAVTGVGTLLFSRVKIKNLQAQEKIHHLAHHDSLTGLCNRRLFIQLLELEIAHARRKDTPLAVIYLDLDRFKPINDQFGHDAGDYVLQEVSQRLRTALRDSDTLSRLGGDEFAAILPMAGNREHIEQVAERLLSALEYPIIFDNRRLNVGISIGIAEYHTGQLPESLMHEADQAMYHSKQAGRNGYHFANSRDC